jgi:hypothetical protein
MSGDEWLPAYLLDVLDDQAEIARNWSTAVSTEHRKDRKYKIRGSGLTQHNDHEVAES